MPANDILPDAILQAVGHIADAVGCYEIEAHLDCTDISIFVNVHFCKISVPIAVEKGYMWNFPIMAMNKDLHGTGWQVYSILLSRRSSLFDGGFAATVLLRKDELFNFCH